MSAVGGVGGIDRVMALRAQILERNAALSRAGAAAPAAAPQGASANATSFADTMQSALAKVNDGQQKASALSEQYERGETVDIAKVMLARQEASVGFEATLQVRNKILSAYKDIMSMPV
ncbi:MULTISPECIES: flagellar hook-basal body complex protein FliE [Sphingomonas]|uniref:Flagellar hook-basal body complex protein FliE n=1 Tax=Sphingomonas citri TaxID=2862499 RepID=A0ABS7BRQ3_9SPHN|nr:MULTISPECIES: flagellar hook-basal body complex protein FliE [Sphingomonas]MBB3694196.1 flagellar hook-basal body complex protein FliE [Sphingomonas sp. BK580]MBW6532152.1 flagellar hook-basal body complex protein FliE [Sphingomonas citri]